MTDALSEEMTEARQMGFTLILDNVNLHTNASQGTGNQDLNQVQSYGALDRVPSFHLSDTAPSAEDIASIPAEIFLPTNEDTDSLRYSIQFLVMGM